MHNVIGSWAISINHFTLFEGQRKTKDRRETKDTELEEINLKKRLKYKIFHQLSYFSYKSS